jgi:ATP-binding cassette subfamily D (ALD) protein 3
VAERITVEIEHFSEEFSEIYTGTFKPIMDILFFTYKLSESTTWRGPMILYSYFLLSSLCKMVLDPNLGKLNAKESQLQGDFRSAHERLITNSEEVAFYDGSKRERTIINKKLEQLHDQVIINSLSHLFIHVVDNIIVKYWATLIGYISIFSPILFGLSVIKKKTQTELAEDYARNTRYLSSLSDAIGSFVLLGNKISELRGHVHRVGEVIAILDHIEDNVKEFERKPPEQLEFTSTKNVVFLKHWKERCDEARDHEHHSHVVSKVGTVTLEAADHISFEHIDIISPEGKVLVEDLTFTVKQNQNVMVTGPNGCGKSSLFRIIGDLWPPSSHPGKEGRIVKPKKNRYRIYPSKTLFGSWYFKRSDYLSPF